MKRKISLIIITALLLTAVLAAACGKNGTEREASGTAAPSGENETPDPAAPSGEKATPEPTEATPEPAEATAAPTAEPQSAFKPNERPEEVTVEWLAAEMMYRWYLGYLNLEVEDYSDIMDLNADTDMFFYSNRLEIDYVKLGLMKNILGAAQGTAGISYVVEESETEITAHVYVSTHVNWDDPYTSDPGTNFQITVDKQRMVITAFDQFLCEGIYNNAMQPLALKYRIDHPWEEADRLAYEELYARLEASGSLH